MRLLPPATGRAVTRLGRTSLLIAAMALSACSKTLAGYGVPGFEPPETAVAYEVALEGAPPGPVTDLAEQALASYRLQDGGATSLAFLRRRAEADVATLMKILRSEGYYGATAEVRVEAPEEGPALVSFSVTPGAPFTLAEHRFDIRHDGPAAPPVPDSAALGSPVGDVARAAPIAAAEAGAVVELQHAGFPYARFDGREGLADLAAATLAVTSRIEAGAAYGFGPVGFEGDLPVPESYLLSYLPWTPGDPFDLSQLAEFQRRLVATGLFRAARVSPPEAAPPAGDPPPALPVSVHLEEGPPRTIAGGLRYDTDLGPEVRASFEHRNFLGTNERFLAEAEGGLIEQQLGLGLRKPQYLRPGQDLVTELTVLRHDDDDYFAFTGTGFAGIERMLDPRWKVGLGVIGEIGEIEDNGGGREWAYLGGLAGFAAYDGSNDLLDPTEGYRLRVEATPFVGIFGGDDAEFLVLDAHGSAYLPLDEASDYVVAVRGRVASILAPELTTVPANRRLYAGGGGSVRGYAQNFIGPLDGENNPVGGRSALEAGLELRSAIWGDIGGALFAEAGTVSTEPWPDFDDGLQSAVGFGLRYGSPVGPIRFDLAFPIDRRPADDAYQFYFAIGQAF